MSGHLFSSRFDGRCAACGQSPPGETVCPCCSCGLARGTCLLHDEPRSNPEAGR